MNRIEFIQSLNKEDTSNSHIDELVYFFDHIISAYNYMTGYNITSQNIVNTLYDLQNSSLSIVIDNIDLSNAINRCISVYGKEFIVEVQYPNIINIKVL